MKVEIEDTYVEAFDGLYSRVIVTAEHQEVLKRAAEDATATPSIVIGRIEGGIEKWLSTKETPDGRRGAILQFWGGIDESKPLEKSVKKFEKELLPFIIPLIISFYIVFGLLFSYSIGLFLFSEVNYMFSGMFVLISFLALYTTYYLAVDYFKIIALKYDKKINIKFTALKKRIKKLFKKKKT